MFRFTIAAPSLLFCLLTLAPGVVRSTPGLEPPVVHYVSQGPIYEVGEVDTAPMFPGCEKELDLKKRANCSYGAMMESIARAVKYPAADRENGIEGTPVISFVIEMDGSITNTEIFDDPGGTLGDCILTIVEDWQDHDLHFSPGLISGKPVRVQYFVSFGFNLE